MTIETPKANELRSNLSTTFNSLVNSITTRFPVANTQGKILIKDLEPEEINQIKFIKSNTTPEELAQIIFENPPTVHVAKSDEQGETYSVTPEPFTITQPPEEDIKAASQQTFIPENELSYGKKLFLNPLINQAKKYLLTPTIDDHLENHNLERQPWKMGVSRVLDLFQKTSAKIHWAQIVNDSLINNRYRSSMITKLACFIIERNKDETLPDFYLKLIEIKHRLLSLTDKYKNKNTVDEASKQVAIECKNIIALFSKSDESSD